jgi:3-oxoacyl-[acyl-carrier-protein] synthase I
MQEPAAAFPLPPGTGHETGVALAIGSASRQRSLHLAGTIAIRAMGAVTPVGIGIAQTLCSIRSMTCRMQEMPELYSSVSQDAAVDPPEPVVAAPLGFLERDTPSEQDQWRWLARLLVAAFEDLRRTFPELWRNPSRTGLFINLPLARPGLSQELAKPLLTAFYNRARIDECACPHLYFGGHAGSFALAIDACEAIRQGHIDTALVGGADSYLFRPVLASLDEAYRLKSERNLCGFRPAEGAGFVALEAARRSGTPPLALLDCIASSARPTGEQGLTEVLRSLGAPGTAPTRVISDMNGETARAREWAIVATRLGQHLGDASTIEHPALSTGDIGAATGPVLLGHAVGTLARGKSLDQPIWVYASSDDSVRAGASLRRPVPPS